MVSFAIASQADELASEVLSQLAHYAKDDNLNCDLPSDVARRLAYIVRLFDKFEITAASAIRNNRALVDELLVTLTEQLKRRSWTSGQRSWVDLVMRFLVERHGHVLTQVGTRLDPAEVLASTRPKEEGE